MRPSHNLLGENVLTIRAVFVAVIRGCSTIFRIPPISRPVLPRLWLWAICGAGLINVFLPLPGFTELPPEGYPQETDLAVNAVFLKFRKSAEDVLGRSIKSAPKADYDELVCLSGDGKERLTLIKRKEGEENSFHRFIVSKNSPPLDQAGCRLKGPIRSFRGVALGMSVEEITKIFGGGYQVEEGAKLLSIRYSLENSISSRFLQYYHELRYYGYYRFKDGKLVEFSFGFDPEPAALFPNS